MWQIVHQVFVDAAPFMTAVYSNYNSRNDHTCSWYSMCGKFARTGFSFKFILYEYVVLTSADRNDILTVKY